jgi:hypothetical protein
LRILINVFDTPHADTRYFGDVGRTRSTRFLQPGQK